MCPIGYNVLCNLRGKRATRHIPPPGKKEMRVHFLGCGASSRGLARSYLESDDVRTFCRSFPSERATDNYHHAIRHDGSAMSTSISPHPSNSADGGFTVGTSRSLRPQLVIFDKHPTRHLPSQLLKRVSKGSPQLDLDRECGIFRTPPI